MSLTTSLQHVSVTQLVSSVYDSHHTRVCTVAMGHVVVDISARDRNAVRHFLKFLRISLSVSPAEAMGKCRFYGSCHALTVHQHHSESILPTLHYPDIYAIFVV